MTDGTARGPRLVRAELRQRIITGLPPLVDFLRGEWADPDAFPPAGPEEDAAAVPASTDNVQTAMGRPLDRYPVVQVELGSSSVRRAATETIEGTDSILYFVTYSVSLYVYVDVTPPEDLDIQEEREWATDCRDDLQMALRYLLLDRPVGDPPMVVLPNTYAEDYGEPQEASGQRWTVGGRARFSVRAQERLSRTSLATVTPDAPELDYGVTVDAFAPLDKPISHPALP